MGTRQLETCDTTDSDDKVRHGMILLALFKEEYNSVSKFRGPVNLKSLATLRQ